MTTGRTFFAQMCNSANRQKELDREIELQRLKNECPWDRDVCLRENAHILAMLGLQSSRYHDDPTYRESVDDVLALTNPSDSKTAPEVPEK